MDDMTLRDTLRAVQTEVAGEIARPTVGAIRDRLRRHRQRRAAGTTALAVVLLAAVSVPLWSGHSNHHQLPTVAPTSPPVTVSALPSVVPTVSTSVSASGTATAGHPAPPRRVTGGPTKTKTVRCIPQDVADVQGSGSTIIFAGDVDKSDRLCRGESLKVFWVQYEYLPDGSQAVYSSHVAYLTTAHPTDTSAYPSVDGGHCAGDLYYVAGPLGIIPTIPAGAHDPYPGRNAKTGGVVGSSYSQPCAVDTPSPAPPPSPEAQAS